MGTKTAKVREVVKVEPVKMVVSEVKELGELWAKGCDFNDTATKVKAFVLITKDGSRKLTFQTYDGTYGKSGKTPPFDQINKNGYKIADVDAERESLKAKGYERVR